jgi:hypothetical protein
LKQYLVSSDSLEAMDILEMKSFLDCAAMASFTFAPILVPLLNICLENTYSLFELIFYKDQLFEEKN